MKVGPERREEGLVLGQLLLELGLGDPDDHLAELHHVPHVDQHLARSRVDEICGALWSGIADLTADEVQEWRKQIDAADRDGTFFFCEPTVVVSETAD